MKLTKLKRRQSTMNKRAIVPLRRALERAVAIATAQNIPPLRGRTLVLVAAGRDMDKDFGGVRGVVRKGATLREAGILFGLMAASAAEEPRVVAYNCALGLQDVTKEALEARDGLLEGVAKVSLKVGRGRGSSKVAELDLLRKVLGDLEWIDNLVVIPGLLESQDGNFDALKQWAKHYRHLVNPDLVLACVNIEGGGRGKKRDEEEERHSNDFFVSGFSETIFQCLANSGGNGQVDLVECADRRYNLAPPARKDFETVLPRELLQDVGSTPKWKRVRVFVSSTFRDMHGERDLLNRFVMPELRRRARKLHVEVQVIDLRWGITESSADLDGEDFLSVSHSLTAGSGGSDGGLSQVLACLKEAERCQLFVGFLGERYGWKPPLAQAYLEEKETRSKKARELLKMLRLGLGSARLAELSRISITEMEMELAALNKKEEMGGRAFFFLRDGDRFFAQLSRADASNFVCEDGEDQRRLAELKERVRSSGLEVFDGYPARYGGVVRGKPVAEGLEELGQRVVDVLWNAITTLAGEEEGEEEESAVVKGGRSCVMEQEAFCNNLVKHDFVPRPKSTESVMKAVQAACEAGAGLVEVNGKPGSGSTSILCKVCKDLISQAKKKSLVVIPFFAEAVDPPANNHEGLSVLLRYLASHLGKLTGSQQFQSPSDLKAMGVKVASAMLSAAEAVTSANRNGRLIIVVDGIEMSKAATSLTNQVEWLPPSLPKGVVLLVSSYAGGAWSKYLQQRKEECGHSIFRVPALDMPERKALVRHFLQQQGKRLEEGVLIDNQLGVVVSKRDAGNAGYLRLLTTEIGGLGVFEELGQRLSEAGGTAKELLEQVMERCEDELGQECVGDALSLLAVATHSGCGLTDASLREAVRCLHLCREQPELAKKTARKIGEFLGGAQPTVEEFLPSAKLSVLLNSLEGFVQPTEQSLMEGVLLIKPGGWEEAVRERYLGGAGGARKEEMLHRALSATLDRLYRLTPEDPQVLDSLPYHLARSGQVKDLEEVVCDVAYVRRCAAVGLLPSLLRHLLGLNVQARSLRERFASSPRVRDFHAFVRLNRRELCELPCLTAQLAACEAPDSHVAMAAERAMTEDDSPTGPPVAFSWLNRPPSSERPLLSCTRFSPATEVTAMATERSTVIRPEELLAAQGFGDGSILVCLAQSGVELFSLLGHAAPITALVFMTGGSSGELVACQFA